MASAGAADPEKTQGHLCEAWYYAGMKRLLSGERKTATDDFNRCVATKRPEFVEYALAKGELAGL